MSLVTAVKTTPVVPDVTWTMLIITEVFEKLTKSTNRNKRLIIEKQKLALMQVVEKKIKNSLSVHKVSQAAVKAASHSLIKKILNRAFYYFLLLFGLLEDSAGSYLFGSALFSLIPGIPHAVLITASIVYTVLDCILFYAFEVSILKEALGLSYTNSNLHQLLEAYASELKTAKAIHQLLSTIPILDIDNEMYDEYVAFATLVNQDLCAKNEAIGAYRESIPRKILKYGVLAFGALSSLAGSYFMATSFMTMGAPILIGTPLGWILTLLTITAGLGFYYAMGARGMSRLVNPDYDRFHEMKKELNVFQDEYSNALGQIKLTKHRFEKKQTVESTVQTDRPSSPSHSSGHSFFPAVSQRVCVNAESQTDMSDSVLQRFGVFI